MRLNEYLHHMVKQSLTVLPLKDKNLILICKQTKL